MATKSIEQKVRDYLAFLSDPSVGVDQQAVARAEKRAEEAALGDEPLEAIKAYRDLKDAKRPDGSKLEQDFIEVAYKWATANMIDAEAFQEVHGVSRKVLRDAGFQVRTSEYKERTPSGVVQHHVQRIRKNKPFTVKEVAEATNASVAGARNVLTDMIDQGTVETLPTEKAKTRGRPPVRYARVA